MKKAIVMLIVCLCMTMSVPTLAYSYEFSGSATALGRATSTDEPVPLSPMNENTRRDKDAAVMPPPYIVGSGSIPTGASGLFNPVPPVDGGGYVTSTSVIAQNTAPSYYANGSIGTLSIPALGITMKAYEGETTESMNKGVGHFVGTSAWDGNIGLCGHNRGGNYNIGTIKNLRAGDTIHYTTPQGSRTYTVTFVGTISNIDWTYLGATTDNRITLITCLADQPSLRVCVQAVEI